MARSLTRRVLQVITLFIVSFFSTCSASHSNYSEIYSLSVVKIDNVLVNNDNFKKVVLEVHGKNIYNGMQIKISKTKTQRNVECGQDLINYNVTQVATSLIKARYLLIIPRSVTGDIFLCLPRTVQNLNNIFSDSTAGDSWIHQGKNVTFNIDWSRKYTEVDVYNTDQPNK